MRLFEFERTWGAAAFEGVFPEGTALPHGIGRMGPGQFLADSIATSPFEPSVGLRAALWLIALAPLWLLRRPCSIATLEPHERQEVLERLLASRVYAIRQLTVAFKAMASLLYAQSPAIRVAMTTPKPAVLNSTLVALGRGRREAKKAKNVKGESHEHAAE